MEIRECDLVIVGAGVAGGSLAAALKDIDLDVVLLDTQPKIPQINKGDHLAPPVVRYLDSLGILDNFEKRGAFHVHEWRAFDPEGDLLAEAILPDFMPEPYDYIQGLPHPLIQESFLEAIEDKPNFELMRGTRATGLITDDGGKAVGVTARHGTADEFEIRAKVVAGCDGVRSLVRREAGIEADIEWQEEYPMITARRHPEQKPDENWEIWSPKGFLGVYPITSELVRCPVQAESGELSRWRKIGFDTVKEELAVKFPWFEKMEIVDEGLHVYKTSKHNSESYVADGVVLIGEAAHTVPPFYGFGMAMAIRDSREASKQLLECFETRDFSAEALKPYEERVVEYNLWAMEANEMFRYVALNYEPTAEGIRRALEDKPALDPSVMGRLYGDW